MAADAVDEGEDENVEVAAVPEPQPKPEPEPEEIPEITLDNAIRQRIDNNLIDEPGQISPTASESGLASAKGDDLPEIKLAPAKSKKADVELERIASELAKAKTIDDVDDKMAETLFGEEINFIASQVLASGSDVSSANDGESDAAGASRPEEAQATGIPADAVSGDLEVSLEAPRQNGAAGEDLSASQRLRTVRSLNTDLQPSAPAASGNEPDPGPDLPAQNAAKPAPIEDQINISMTQTLKALNVQPPVLDDDEDERFDDDDEDEKKSGFFSRFRRS
jgi:hypothetical protein